MGSNADFAHTAPGAVGFTPSHPSAAHLKTIAPGRVGMNGRKKIAICGFASSSRHLIPTDDTTWIIAGLNQLYRHMPRADVWFDIHVNWADHNVEGTDHEGWLKSCGIPVYMSHKPKELPDVIEYPIDRMIARHGVDYFTSTVSFMIAWAMDTIEADIEAGNGVASDYTIGVFGIDLIVGTEYEVQKACAEFWLGVAAGLGINVVIPPQSALLKQSHRYGYALEPDSGLLKFGELKARVGELDGFMKKATPIMHGMNGALQALTDLKAKSEAGTALTPELIAAGIQEATERVQKLVAEVQTYDGAMQEAQHHVNVMELRQRGGTVPLVQADIGG